MTRRNARRKPETDFTVHLQLARAHGLNRRLNRAGVLMLFIALLTWLFQVPFPLQLALVLSGGATAFAWPVHGTEIWSLDWIRTHTGLAYETALQLEQAPRDSFGLRVTVRSHARTAIARMDRPQYQSWWLAGVVLTALILLLPALNFNSPWNLPDPRGPASSGSAPLSQQQDEPAAAAEEEATAEAEQPEAPEEPAMQPPAEAAGPEGTQADSDAAAGAGDSAVLDRFLDNLRPRPPEEETQQVQAASTQPLGAPADPSEGEPAPEDDAARQDGAQQAAERAEAKADADSSTADGAGDDTGEGASEMEAAAGEEEGDEAGASQADGVPEGQDAQDGASVATEGDTLEEGSDGTGIGGGADDSAGVDGPGEASERLGAAAEAEFLEGQLAGDAASQAGSVRLPPFTDVELPRGSNATEFTRVAERAVTEGQVPLEYQEIIRNYFRP